jgi:hypothetical protein
MPRKGRPPGSRPYETEDRPLRELMAVLRHLRLAHSDWAAAKMVARYAPGASPAAQAVSRAAPRLPNMVQWPGGPEVELAHP